MDPPPCSPPTRAHSSLPEGPGLLRPPEGTASVSPTSARVHARAKQVTRLGGRSHQHSLRLGGGHSGGGRRDGGGRRPRSSLGADGGRWALAGARGPSLGRQQGRGWRPGGQFFPRPTRRRGWGLAAQWQASVEIKAFRREERRLSPRLCSKSPSSPALGCNKGVRGGAVK